MISNSVHHQTFVSVEGSVKGCSVQSGCSNFCGEEVRGTKGCLPPPLPILCSLFVNILPVNILCLYSIKIDFETACLFPLQLRLQEFNNSTRSTNKF